MSGEHEYSQGVMSDGAVILRDGLPMTPDEIVRQLREAQERADKAEAQIETLHDVIEGWRQRCERLERLYIDAVGGRREFRRLYRAEKDRCERLENIGRLLQEWVDGIVADFYGVTDNANDPYRLHTWDDLERCERPVPDFHAALSEPDEQAMEGKV